MVQWILHFSIHVYNVWVRNISSFLVILWGYCATLPPSSLKFTKETQNCTVVFSIAWHSVERRKNHGGIRGQPNTAYQAYQTDAMQNSNYHRDNYYPSNGDPSYGTPAGYGYGYSAGGGYPASPASITGYRPSNAPYPTSGTRPPNPPHYYK